MSINNLKKHQELREQIKEQICLSDIAEEWYTVLNKNRSTSKIAEHDSVIIFNDTNSFYRYATGEGGDVLKFLQVMPEIKMTYKEAFDYLKKKIDPTIKPIFSQKNQANPTKKRGFTQSTTSVKKDKDNYTMIPNRSTLLAQQINFDEENKNVIAYLIQIRKIHPDIVFEFIDKHLLKQETNKEGYKSALFIGYDNAGEYACICKRACSQNSTFKGDLSGNNYTYGWLYDPEVHPMYMGLSIMFGEQEVYNPSKTLICFESEIEKMSYLSLMKINGEDIKQYAYLSTGSASKYNTIVNVVKRNNYKNVIIAYNNDAIRKDTNIDTGKIMSEKAIAELNKLDIEAKRIYPEHDNDWNDMLVRVVNEKGINYSKPKSQPTFNSISAIKQQAQENVKTYNRNNTQSKLKDQER